VNGEAIYNTRPWTIHAEGDEAKLRTPGEHPKWTFTNVATSDIRFTQPKKGGAIYAVSLAWPKDGRSVTIHSINARTLPHGIASITLLGHRGELKFTRHADGLRVDLPAPPASAADGRPFALKIVPAKTR
jgi:alpha-L-fucosidase